MTKVLFITGKLQPYRIPILNLIAENPNIELTVAHSSKRIAGDKDLFEEVIITEKKLGPFTYHKTGFIDFCKKFDVVVAMFYIQKISFMSLLLYKKHFKLIYWGIGVRASQKNKFDKPSIVNYLRYYVAKKSDAMIFYSEYAKNKYINKGVAKDKIFVMPNTVEVLNLNKTLQNKDCITFLGTLNKSKNIFALLEAYLKIYRLYNHLPNLEIIGKGDDYSKVKAWIKHNLLQDKVICHGAIYDSELKSKVLKRSFVNISPSQAGLSVLECFGYGIPFATSNDAFTGGERLNIKNNINGFLLEEDDLINDISDVILLTINNKKRLLEMGIEAKKFYDSYRTPNIMANGFLDAVNYVLK